MTKAATQVISAAQPFHAYGAYNAKQVHNHAPVEIGWGEVMPIGRTATNVSGGSDTIDLSLGPWILVTTQGTGTPLIAATESQEAALDGLLSGATWVVLARQVGTQFVLWQNY